MSANAVAAVVVTYNRKQILEQCLSALNTQTFRPSEILVVDNGSADGTADYVTRMFPGVRILRLLENSGPAQAFLEGLKETYNRGHVWFWLMDDDAIPDKNCLENLVKESDRFKAMVPVVKNPSGSDDVRVVNTVRMIQSNLLRQENPWKLYHDIVSCYPLLGLLINREVISRVGYPDPQLFIQGDDIDFTLRISKYYPIKVVRSATIVHLATEESMYEYGRFLWYNLRFISPIYLWKVYYATRNQVYLAKRYGSRRAAVWQTLRIIRWGVADTVKAVISGYQDPKRLQVYIDGLLDGWLGQLGRNVRYLPGTMKLCQRRKA